jgi:hypothetical protein
MLPQSTTVRLNQAELSSDLSGHVRIMNSDDNLSEIRVPSLTELTVRFRAAIPS